MDWEGGTHFLLNIEHQLQRILTLNEDAFNTVKDAADIRNFPAVPENTMAAIAM